MSKLTFFDMNHGDCFLIHDDKYGMMIDCGSNFPSVSTKSQMVLASELAKKKKIDLVISHLDQDHINLIQRLPSTVTFENVYLSNMINPRDISVLFSVLAIFRHTTRAYQIAYNYLMFIPLISAHLNSKSAIHYISYPKRIHAPICCFDVLWPQFLPASPGLMVDDEVIQRYTRHFLSMISEFIDDDGRIELANGFKDSDLVQSISSLIFGFLEEKPSFRQGSISEKRSVLKSHVKNYSSLVLLEESKSLFLGDIDWRTFERHICELVPTHVRFLKTPHHGSKSQFSSRLPSAEVALIPEFADGRHIHWIGYSPRKFLFRVVGSPRMTLPALPISTIVVDTSFNFYY